jgi:hypothetical protein
MDKNMPASTAAATPGELFINIRGWDWSAREGNSVGEGSNRFDHRLAEGLGVSGALTDLGFRRFQGNLEESAGGKLHVRF